MADEFTFEPNPNIDEELGNADLPVIKTSSKEVAEDIARVARQLAPSGPSNSGSEPGAYVDGIVVQETKTGARVLASDYKSAWIEFGVPSQGQPARFVLRRAVEAAGYKFRKRGS